jgi:hypothetical protein
VGKVEEIERVFDHSGRFRGTAYVQYATREAAADALALHRLSYKGQALQVQPADRVVANVRQASPSAPPAAAPFRIRNVVRGISSNSIQVLVGQFGPVASVVLDDPDPQAPTVEAVVTMATADAATIAANGVDGIALGPHVLAVVRPEHVVSPEARSPETAVRHSEDT